MLASLPQLWGHLVVVLHVAVAIAVSAHVILFKRDPRAAIGWVGIVWLTPFLGSLLYAVFGVNRIRRRARSRRPGGAAPGLGSTSPVDGRWKGATDGGGPTIRDLVRLVDEVTRRPLLPGNLVEPLATGEAAFSAMVEAIAHAERSVGLSTYIFDADRAGARFVEVLEQATERGVEVRVLIDDVGGRYSWPSTARTLRRRGVPVASFMPTTLPWRFQYSNLRNHRKILVVDGRVGFTGGMNIREGGMSDAPPRHRLDDLHFRVRGPVVAELQRVFVDDWSFSTAEVLEGESWFPAPVQVGQVWCRAIVDGPDDDFDKLRMVLLGAAACATRSLVVVTPYFLPDDALLTALNVAAMRGVNVDVVLPSQNNLSLVAWASTTLWPALLEHGCRIWMTPPPFDHTKLMLVDDSWSLIGSANWDPRSLQLNFELDVECHDAELCATLRQLVATKLAAAREVTLAELQARPLAARLRDGVARLAIPYL